MANKTLVTYSTLTGNTRKVAEAIFESLAGEKEILPISAVSDPNQYAKIALGYWVDKGDVNKEAQDFLAQVTGKEVGLFGTLGAEPNGEHAQVCKTRAAGHAEKGGNSVRVNFLCQGAVAPALIERIKKMAAESKDPRFAITHVREERWAEAAKHPNAMDFEAAKKAFVEF